MFQKTALSVPQRVRLACSARRRFWLSVRLFLESLLRLPIFSPTLVAGARLELAT